MTDIILDLTKPIDFTSEDILSSEILRGIVKEYLTSLPYTNPVLSELLCETFGENNKTDGLVSFFERLSKNKYKDVKEEYMPLSQEEDTVLNLLDSIYDIWRKKERYAEVRTDVNPMASKDFISLTDKFSRHVIRTYREIYENVLGKEQTVYRQLPSGTNASFILSKSIMNLPEELGFLSETETLKALVIRPPFIVSSKLNTRKGVFFEHNEPLLPSRYNPDDYRAVCLLIKGYVGYVFIHKDYMSFLVALGNLFQIAKFDDFKNNKPTFIVVFGGDTDTLEPYYYQTKDKTYVGICPLKGEIGYFGYLKKIILTLHNLHMIDLGRLPIHGACFRISLTDNRAYNIVILGDSGAGKSETIEAIKSLGSKDVYQIDTIYDDMGTFQIRDGQVMTNGTETGAFVRLDDLDKGYSLKSVDRAIYINVELVNSRVVIPIETYKTSKELHKVDFFLLADNFTDTEEGIKQYTDQEEAKAEFKKGARVAKGTTSEKGLVTTFFANPFGPLQRQADTSKLIDNYFEKLYKNHIFVGRVYTKLSIDPTDGPKKGAQSILELLRKLG